MPLEIPLNRGYRALVDEEDAGALLSRRWSVCLRQNGRAYATGRIDGRAVWMHRFILGLKPGDPFVDHIDHDGLNNQRSNLRLATHGQNTSHARFDRMIRLNKHGFIGVVQQPGGWYGRVSKDGKDHYTAKCSSACEAAIARDRLAAALWGEFATLNFPCVQAA